MTAPILIVGNSYAGAIIGAIERDPDGRLADRLDVAAAGGPNYRLIGIEDGRVVRARLYRERRRPVRDYRAIFLYGYLPHPIELVAMRHRLRKQRFSARVVALALRDAVSGADSLRLADRFRAETEAPILVLPGNPAVNAPATTAEDREEMLTLVREVVGHAYLPSPAAFLDAEGRPIPAYYKDSVTITGQFTADPRQDKHDLLHLNPAGGALWLAAILDRAAALDGGARG